MSFYTKQYTKIAITEDEYIKIAYDKQAVLQFSNQTTETEYMLRLELFDDKFIDSTVQINFRFDLDNKMLKKDFFSNGSQVLNLNPVFSASSVNFR